MCAHLMEKLDGLFMRVAISCVDLKEVICKLEEYVTQRKLLGAIRCAARCARWVCNSLLQGIQHFPTQRSHCVQIPEHTPLVELARRLHATHHLLAMLLSCMKSGASGISAELVISGKSGISVEVFNIDHLIYFY